MQIKITCNALFALLLVAVALLGSCGNSSPAPASPATDTHESVKPPIVQKAEVADWCKEHGVPESVCTKCNAKLIPEFQAKGDWCKEHSLPESQCVACHPELDAKLKAMAPKSNG